MGLDYDPLQSYSLLYPSIYYPRAWAFTMILYNLIPYYTHRSTTQLDTSYNLLYDSLQTQSLIPTHLRLRTSYHNTCKLVVHLLEWALCSLPHSANIYQLLLGCIKFYERYIQSSGHVYIKVMNMNKHLKLVKSRIMLLISARLHYIIINLSPDTIFAVCTWERQNNDDATWWWWEKGKLCRGHNDARRGSWEKEWETLKMVGWAMDRVPWRVGGHINTLDNMWEIMEPIYVCVHIHT